MSDFELSRPQNDQPLQGNEQFLPNASDIAPAGNWFKTTHWTVVLDASRGDATQTREALAKLCQTYWYPLYVFIRRQRHSSEDAEDLVQGFFARLLEKNYVREADRDKGKFRSFLLMALERFMANEWDRANRQKRGGGREIISLDGMETRYRAEPADEMTPERAFERRWAMTLLEQVLTRLEGEFSGTDKARLFDELKIFLSGEKSESSYAEIGQRLGLLKAPPGSPCIVCGTGIVSSCGEK